MHCPNCLTTVTDDATECPQCGARRGYASGSKDFAFDIATHTKTKNKNGLISSLIFIPLFGAYIYTLSSSLINTVIILILSYLIVFFVHYYGRVDELRLAGPQWFGPAGYWGQLPPFVFGRLDVAASRPCPYCGGDVRAFSISCPTCRARHGYTLGWRKDLVWGRDEALKNTGLLLYTIAILSFFCEEYLYAIRAWIHEGWNWNAAFPALGLTIFSMLLVILPFRLFQLWRGPRWFPPYDPARKGRPRPVDDSDAAPHGRRTGSHT